MSIIYDLKGLKLFLIIGLFLLIVMIGWYFGFKQLQKWTTLTSLVQDWLIQNSTFHVEVSAAPTILNKVKDKDIDAKKLDTSSLLYVFNETYENLEFTRQVKDWTLVNHFTDGKTKVVLFTSHPTTVSNYSWIIELNSDGSAKLDNKVFTPRELKYQNTRLKGEYVSWIWFGLFSSDEADKLQKTTFPHALKIKVKDDKYLLVSEGIGENTYGKNANIGIIDADAIPDEPNSDGAISAIIPSLIDADKKTWTIDERVWEIIYQSDGTIKIKSHFTTPTANISWILNIRVISQDKIEATVEHYWEVRCNDPVNYKVHNLDCVALPHDETPAWKDDKIKELEEEVKKYNELKKDGYLSYKCVQHASLNNRENTWDKSWYFSFLDDEDCGHYQTIAWNINWRNSRQEMALVFHPTSKTTYLKDIEQCKSAWQEFVCYFKWNNPMKIKQLYFKVGNWDYNSTAHILKTMRTNWERKCADIEPTKWKYFEKFSMFNSSFSQYEWLYWMFQTDSRSHSINWENTIQSVRDLMKNFIPLSLSIENYLKSLSNDNLIGDVELFNKNWKFSLIGIMYWENKQVQPNFVWDTYVNKLWWYGSWPQFWKILDDINLKIWDKWITNKVPCQVTNSSDPSRAAHPERKNYWLMIKYNGKRARISDSERKKFSNSQYDIASILLL